MAYIGSSPTKVVSRQSANIFTYTATANQTAFTGADANGNTLACTPSDIMVHMNGIKLEESDYTASTTTVTLGSGAAAGDEVTITAFVTFETADAYTKSASDTRYVNASGDTMSGNLTASVGITIADDNNLKFGDGTAYIQGSGANDRLKFIANNTEHMRVHSAGYVTKPNQPSFMAFANPTRDTSGTYNEILRNFGTVRHNIGNHYDNSTGRFTAPVSGRYLFNAVITYDQSVSFSYLLYFQINGAASFVGANQNYGTTSMSVVYNLNANDYVDLHSDRAHYASTPRNHWSGYLLG